MSQLYSGGALFALEKASIEISSCTFANNTASIGGAVYVAGKILTKECDFLGNFATYFGGGLFLMAMEDGSAEREVINSAFTENKAEVFAGGGLYWLAD